MDRALRPSLAVAYACLAASMMLVGSYVALSKPLAAIFPVFLLAWLRFGIGGVAMLHWLRKPASEPRMTVRTRLLVFLESFLGNFLFTICMIAGVSMTGAAVAGVIMAFIPAAVALMSRVFLKEEISSRVWWAVALGVAGIALLAAGGAAPGDAQHAGATLQGGPALPGNSSSHAGPALQAGPAARAWLGHVLLMIAVFCEASYAVIGKTLTAVLSPRRISAIINLWGFVLTMPVGAWLAWQYDFSAVPVGVWALLIFYGLAASVWTVPLWMTGLRVVPASRAGVFMVLLPVTAALVGVLALGESLTTLQWLAFLPALAGLVLATFPARTGNTGD